MRSARLKLNHRVFLKTSRSGVALLYALLVLGTVSLVSLIIATLTLRNIKMARDVGSGIIAYYAADSGMERALYEIMVNGNTSNMPNTPLRELTSANYSYTVDDTFNCSNYYTQDSLDMDETLDFDNLGNSTRMHLSWSQRLGNANEEVEVTWLGWEDNFSDFGPESLANYKFGQGTQTVYKETFDYGELQSEGGEIVRQLVNKPNNLVRVKPLKDFVSDFQICFDNGVDITDKVRIDSVGIFSSYKKAIESTYSSTKAGVSGYFDYVIFSEQSLSK
ncbi:MAG: hypothetical protein PHW01_01570 [Patescibacteria group bacterium]|nr:hypothetical protein [Patescibacteria group bacterium]